MRIERIQLTDDLDGKEGDETVRYSLDGKHYEIDLSAKNAAKLRKALAPYVAASRPDRTVLMAVRTARNSGRRIPPPILAPAERRKGPQRAS